MLGEIKRFQSLTNFMNIQEELLSIAKNKLDESLLTMEDVNKMSYGLKVRQFRLIFCFNSQGNIFYSIHKLITYLANGQVVRETLRMSNVLLWFPRVALNDCTIEGSCLSILFVYLEIISSLKV